MRRRTTTASLATVLAGALTVLFAGVAGAATPEGGTANLSIIGSPCSPASSGVTVMVDYTQMTAAGAEKPVGLGCAPGTPDNGGAALTEAGFDVSPGDFLTSIDGQPQADQFPDGFWAYYHADAATDATWQFMQVGQKDAHPQAGSLDAWVFVTDYNVQPTPEPVLSPAEAAAGGTQEPTEATTDVAATTAAATTQDATTTQATASSEATTDTPSPSPTPASGVTPTTWIIVIGVIVVVLIVATIIGTAVRRRAERQDDAPGPGNGGNGGNA